MVDLQGKVALVTGASGGMGREEAGALAAGGAAVVLTDVRDEGRELAESLGPGALFLRHDVSSASDWDTVVKTTVSEFGRLDVLVNNAGLYSGKWLEDETQETFERLFKVNLLGTFLGMKAVIEPMRANGSGSIINISSQAGLQGIAAHAAYGATKWGVRGLSKTAALELGQFGIRVNSVHPGTIDTEMMQFLGLRRGEGNFPIVPLGRVGTPDDVAGLVAFLASDQAAYISGGEFSVDGGAMAGSAPGGFRQMLNR